MNFYIKEIIIILLFVVITSCNVDDIGSYDQIYEASDEIAECPIGFIAISGNLDLGTTDFCVMQFEAKNNGYDGAISRPEGVPYVDVTAFEAQAKCEAMNEIGYNGAFSLISNPQWMTIARDIEEVSANWSEGTVGNGYISKGHSDNWPERALEVTDIFDFYNGTENSIDSNRNQGRVLLLSNNNLIWDFAGNVWEWTDWDTLMPGFTIGPTCDSVEEAAAGWRSLSELSCNMNSNDIQPIGDFGFDQNFGRWYTFYEGSGGAARRGGNFRTIESGAFSVAVNILPNVKNAFSGFRCVYIQSSN